MAYHRKPQHPCGFQLFFLKIQELSAAVNRGNKVRLALTTDADRVDASLRGDSERAGQIMADVHTRLQRLDGSWTKPTSAALAGILKV